MTTVDRPTSQGWVADDSTFGARLALIRQRMRWGNVKEAAVACGLPVESWRSWERDGRTPQRIVEISAIIAERTGCDRGWLLAGPSLRGQGADGGLNVAKARPARPADPDRVTPTSGGPFSGGRRDSTRPVSAIPGKRRRPQVVRRADRPRAA